MGKPVGMADRRVDDMKDGNEQEELRGDGITVERLLEKVSLWSNGSGDCQVGCGCHMKPDDNNPDEAQSGLLQNLEFFFSAPEFTGYVRKFMEEQGQVFVLVLEGEEQPLW